MRRTTLLTCSVLLLAGVLAAPPASAQTVTRTPDAAAYSVDLAAAGRGRSWAGSWSVTFTNTGADPLPEIWVRLWANGVGRCKDPGITVSNVTGGTAGDLTVACTALPITLNTPLAPGGAATIGMDVDIRPPHLNDRFGWFDHTAMMGNALPVLAVNDDEGWHLDPYVDYGESFYSLVSDWEVTLVVPPDLETPATGVQETTSLTPEGLESRVFVAADVRDLGWSAGEFESTSGLDANGVAVQLWYEAGSVPQGKIDKLLNASIRSMDTFSLSYGAYPYAEVDIVIAGFKTFAGMEYPQLIFSIPDRLVIAHELAHQWWFGIIGNDEFEDPWIDESFAQWSMFLPFERNRFWPPLPWVGCPMFSWPNDQVRVSSSMDYFLEHPEDYWIPYWQGGCALAHLAKDFGLERFRQVLHDYAADHWLGVATTADFQAAIEAAAATDGLELDPSKFWARWRIERPAGASTDLASDAGSGTGPPRTWSIARAPSWG